MADTSLKDRLRDHSEAFDSLLSLIPAKLYYGEEDKGDNQWQRKKQTKEQARAAKRSKLDPDSALNRNAKEVLDERARNKRKAQELEESEDEEGQDDDNDDEESVVVDGIEKELPGQGLKKRRATEDGPTNKKAKVSESNPEQEMETAAEQVSAHQQKKLAKLQKKAEKKAEKKANKSEKPVKKSKHGMDQGGVEALEDTKLAQPEDDLVLSKESDEEGQKTYKSKDLLPIDVSGLADDEDANHTSQSSTPASPTFDSTTENLAAEPTSTTTSIASDVAPTTERPFSSSKKLKVPSDTTELRARLAAKISALRAARKADGPDGTPIRTRQELIESRRQKQIKSKAHKKELWQKQKAEEDKKREEALASARNSPMLSFGSPGSPEQENNFSFGRVAFTDGTQMSQDLSYIKDKSGKKKGNSDPKGALAKLEAQKKRLANLDADKRKEVLEKETWLAARKRAEGEKVRNDESLLKKAVKRKERTKKKSEKEWNDRLDGVKYAQKQRAQKREANIRQRKEQKQAGKGGKKGKGKGPTKKKARPGFEGGGFGGKRK
ncbi:hypothetical protein N0V82_002123 [Gnomoniopsis sp. IMI 355080]|nr:hypothetical protein N0V82_002123 [Gnomoniopsis sp. IMI 355080]